MNRYYLPVDEWSDGSIDLTGDEAKHCTRVMRANTGDHIEVFDGEGKSAVCEINSVSRDLVHATVLSQQSHQSVDHPITLCQAIPKGGNMELIVQKSVELGVSAIQPLITAHTVARPDSVEKKRAKWQRIALEACKQCGQNYLPTILPPLSFGQWMATADEFDTRLIAALDERAVNLKALFSSQPVTGSISLLVGPEGDFSPEEYQAAYDAHYQPISFGSIVMRVETATLYGLSIIQHELTAPR